MFIIFQDLNTPKNQHTIKTHKTKPSQETQTVVASSPKMIEERQHGGAPHGILIAVVVSIVVLAPFLLGDQGEAITEAISELLSPMGLLLLPIILLLTIQFLSSDHGSFVSTIFSTGEPDTIHRVSGSPVGVALFLALILFLLYNRMSIFGGDDDSGD